MTTLAAIRAGSVNFPLFLHVFGAMLLVGMLLTVGAAVIVAWRRTDALQSLALTRVGLKTLLFGVFPAYVVMRIGAQWTESRENLPKEVTDSAWIGIGYLTADLGALLILICIILSGIGLWRLRAGKGIVFGRIVGVVATLLLLAYVVAVWAMTTKPD
jgi:hypothetical protein